MLDDALISLMKTRIDKDSSAFDERVLYLLSQWDDVKSAPDISVGKCDMDSPAIIREYILTCLDGNYYNYREDPWFGYSAPFTGGRDENALKLRLLDSEDMAHDLSVLAEDIEESFSLTFHTIREAETMSNFLRTVATSNLLSPSLFDRGKLISFLKGLEGLEELSTAVRRTRDNITQYYTEDIFRIGKSFWKGTLAHESEEYKETRERIEKAKKSGGSLSDAEIKALKSLVLDYKKARRDYRRREEALLPAFPSYSGWSTDWRKVAEEAEALLAFITERDYGILPQVKREDWSEVQKKAWLFYSGLNTIYEKYNESFEAVLSDWDTSVCDLKEIPLSSLEERFHRAGNDAGMRYEWKNAVSVVKKAQENGIITFIDEVLSHHISQKEIIPAFRKALVKKALTSLYRSDENLRKVMERKEEEKKEEKREEADFALYTPLDLRSEAQSFSVDSFSSPSFGDFMKSVVEREAPLFERDLMKRLSFLGGEEYLTPETVENYKKAMEKLDGVSFVRRGGFVYPPVEREYPFRRAFLMRDFSHIAPEELRNGLETIIRKKVETEKGELYNVIGSFCGYSVVLKSRYPELDSILKTIEGITVTGDIIRVGGER